MPDPVATQISGLAALRSRLFDVVPDHVLFALLAYQHRLFEPEIAHLQELVPAGTVAVDIGGWWGPWTYWLSRIAPQVVTCEPIPHLAQFITRVQPGNVQVINAALSDQEGEAPIWLPARGHGTEGVASLEHQAARGKSTEICVRLTTLDALDLRDVGFVKIDVEGHELAVLRGARSTLERWHPTLVVEIEEQLPGDRHVQEVLDTILALGYAGRFLLKGAWHPLSDFDLYENQLRWQAG